MRQALVLALSLCFSLTLIAAEHPDYSAIRATRPDGRGVKVNGLTLTRDVFDFRFHSGTIHFLKPVNGKTIGFVFIGDGSYELHPASENERRHLALLTGTKDFKSLSDKFENVVILFGDGTASEIEKHAAVETSAPDARATTIYEEYLKEQKNKYQVNLHLRVLADLLNQNPKGVFLASVDGKEHPPALLVHDPLGIGNLAAQYGFFGGEESAMIVFDNQTGGLWYLNGSKGSTKNGRGKPLLQIADARHYAIDTTIQGTEITARTTMQLDLVSDNVRVLPIHILPKLRISKATYRIDGQEVADAAIVQEEVELGKFARLFRVEVADADAAVIFPQPLKKGTKLDLTLEYAGRDVLFSIGADTYSVNARDSWYPNVGTFTDLATYELTFRYPKKLHLISVGQRVSESDDEKHRVAVWKSQKPIRVAGFNYGRFERKSQKDADTGIVFDVYANREYTKFSGDMMADAINSARVSTIFFGPVPYSPVSVTQQVQWNFGQSWPSLVYLPTLAFTSQAERMMELGEVLGPAAAEVDEFAKMVGWHEMAHQWWGHHVGWQSYRDQWISEGFAEFSSALVLQFTESFRKYDDYWERRRREILEKSRGNQVRNFEAGPISQGFRLGTHRTPSAPSMIIYGKGAYVLHMIRMMMRGGKNPDEKFIAMMKDFVSSYADKNPSTDDFKKVVERHMTPQMNLAGDATMDWFFDQWIHGTEVPKIKSDIKVSDAGGGKFKVTGSVSQEGVSPGFLTLMPVYADFGKDQIARIGMLRLEGNQSVPFDVEIPMPKLPKKILPNAMHDVLVMD